MATAVKVETTAKGDIALRVFSNKTGAIKLINEIVFKPDLADAIGKKMQAAAEAINTSQSAAEDTELDGMSDEDLD